MAKKNKLEQKPSEENKISDEELMLQCQKDKREAFVELYRRYHQALYRYAYRQLRGDRTKAEDVAQETFLRIYRNRYKYRPTAKFVSWMYRIAHNLCVDEIKRYWSRNVSLNTEMKREVDQRDYTSQVADKAASSLQNLAEQNLAAKIKKAIDKLSPEQKDVIIMNKYQGLSYPEISKILGISPESVKQRAYRAHLKLRELLAPLLEETP